MNHLPGKPYHPYLFFQKDTSATLGKEKWNHPQKHNPLIWLPFREFPFGSFPAPGLGHSLRQDKLEHQHEARPILFLEGLSFKLSSLRRGRPFFSSQNGTAGLGHAIDLVSLEKCGSCICSGNSRFGQICLFPGSGFAKMLQLSLVVDFPMFRWVCPSSVARSCARRRCRSYVADSFSPNQKPSRGGEGGEGDSEGLVRTDATEA